MALGFSSRGSWWRFAVIERSRRLPWSRHRWCAVCCRVCRSDMRATDCKQPMWTNPAPAVTAAKTPLAERPAPRTAPAASREVVEWPGQTAVPASPANFGRHIHVGTIRIRSSRSVRTRRDTSGTGITDRRGDSGIGDDVSDDGLTDGGRLPKCHSRADLSSSRRPSPGPRAHGTISHSGRQNGTNTRLQILPERLYACAELWCGTTHNTLPQNGAGNRHLISLNGHLNRVHLLD